MKKFLTMFLNMMKKNDNAYSVGRLGAVVSLFLWWIVSLYLAYLCKTWDNYDTFTWGVMGINFVQLCNKTVEVVGMFKTSKELP